MICAQVIRQCNKINLAFVSFKGRRTGHRQLYLPATRDETHRQIRLAQIARESGAVQRRARLHELHERGARWRFQVIRRTKV